MNRHASLQISLRTLFLVIGLISIYLAILRLNYLEVNQAIGSHPANIVAAFERFAYVWLGVLCVMFISAAIRPIRLVVVAFGAIASLAFIANVLGPFGLL